MSIVWIGLVLVAISAAMALAQQKWSTPAVLGLIIGLGLAGYGFLASRPPAQVIQETVLASDENPPARPKPAEEQKQPEPPSGEQTKSGAATTKKQEEAKATAVAPAPDIPEHVIGSQEQPWVDELAKLVEKPNHFPLTQSGPAPEDAPNAGDKIYEYVNIKLGGRAFQTVFLSKKPDDPNTWMVHVEPGANGLPIQPEELGKVRILGEGGNFIVFQIESGPFAGNYLIWATGGHRGGGEAIRIYSPSFLSREHGLAAQIAQSSDKNP
ncbi:hypothetical protein [Oceanithermus sp.]